MSDRPPASEHVQREGALALRNALKLGASLLLTWGVAIVVTFKLPNYLGKVVYGHYKYGDTFAMSAAVFLTLGVDTYISREVAVRPKHLSEFFGGVMVMRGLALMPVIIASFFLNVNEVGDRRLAVGLFGVAYIFTAMNNTFQQTLQAASKVDRLAIANVITKVLWGGGTVIAVFLRAPFWVLPMPLVLSEGLKSVVLFLAVREATALDIRFDFAETKRVLRVSFPFFVANVAVSLGSSVDVPILGKIVGKAGEGEVGLYSAARQIAQLSALLSPILSGVLIPMMSRAKVRDEQEFFRILRRGFEGVMVVSIPLTLMLALGADFMVRLLLKPEFGPAALSLQWLAPTFVLAYANVLLWLTLMILDRSWTIMIVSIAGLALLPAFIFVAVPITSHFGLGGSAMGTAMAMSARELVIAVVFMIALRGSAMDRRSQLSIGKSFLACGLVIGLHVLLARVGPARLVADALAYGVLMFGLRIIRPRDVIDVLKMVKNRRNPTS